MASGLLLEELGMGSPIVQSIALFGGLVVQIVTLCYLIKYVRATIGIQRAAVAQTRAGQDLVRAANDQAEVTRELVEAADEQSEGLSKPVVTVRCSVPIPDDMVLLSGHTTARVRGADLELVNIGNGPAIRVHCDLVHQRPAPAPASCHMVEVPYLEAHERIPIPWPRTALAENDTCDIQCSYDSLSGRAHLSKIEMAGDAVTDFHYS
jgi:hypothetical protein